MPEPPAISSARLRGGVLTSEEGGRTLSVRTAPFTPADAVDEADGEGRDEHEGEAHQQREEQVAPHLPQRRKAAPI